MHVSLNAASLYDTLIRQFGMPPSNPRFQRKTNDVICDAANLDALAKATWRKLLCYRFSYEVLMGFIDLIS